MDIARRCINVEEFEPVRSALKEAGYLIGSMSDHHVVIYKSGVNSETQKLIKKYAPSGLTDSGIFA